MPTIAPGLTPAIDAVRMMRPLFCRFIGRTAALMVVNIDVRFVSMTLSHRRSGIASSAPFGSRSPSIERKPGPASMPALANTTSSRPARSTVRSTTLIIAARSVTSTTSPSTAPPRPRSSVTVRSRHARSWSTRVTCAPLSSMASAKARPSPLAPPVIKTERPATLNKSCVFISRSRLQRPASHGILAVPVLGSIEIALIDRFQRVGGLDDLEHAWKVTAGIDVDDAHATRRNIRERDGIVGGFVGSDVLIEGFRADRPVMEAMPLGLDRLLIDRGLVVVLFDQFDHHMTGERHREREAHIGRLPAIKSCLRDKRTAHEPWDEVQPLRKIAHAPVDVGDRVCSLNDASER